MANIEQVVIQQCRIGFVDYMYAGDMAEAEVPDIRMEDVNLGKFNKSLHVILIFRKNIMYILLCFCIWLDLFTTVNSEMLLLIFR